MPMPVSPPFLLRLMIILLTLQRARPLDNGLGRTPGMGWNSDYCTRCVKPGSGGGSGSSSNGFGGENFVRHIAAYLNSSGLQALGYRFVNMDASWDLPTRDPHTGELVPDPALWPSGIETTIAHVHSLGLGFGLYGDKGQLDCAKHPGQLGHEVQDAKFLARIGVDWWKEDSCDSSGTHAEQIAAYAKMRDALNATGRPVWFALCGWQTWYATDSGGGQAIGNSWRIGPDTGTGWSAVLINARRGLEVASSGAPGPSQDGGAWSDGSLLLNPGMGSGADAIDNARCRTMFSLWCVLGFNLLLTGNLSALDPFVLETWGNAAMVAIDQDPAGHPPRLVVNQTAAGAPDSIIASVEDYVQATFQECGGEPAAQRWVVEPNRFWRNDATRSCLNVRNCRTEIIYDACTSTGNASCAHDPPFANEMFDWHAADGTLRTQLAGRAGDCASMDAAGKLALEPCSSPPKLSQTFKYSNATQLFTSAADGRCLTRTTQPSPPGSRTEQWVIARAMANGDTVLLFLNNGNSNANVTCDAACFSAATLPPPSEHAPYVARDLYAPGQTRVLTAPLISVQLDGKGASAVFQLHGVKA